MAPAIVGLGRAMTEGLFTMTPLVLVAVIGVTAWVFRSRDP